MLERSGKRPKNPRRVFRQVDGETHAPSDQQVLGLRTSTVGSTKDMLTPPSPVTIELKTEPVVPEHPTPQLAETRLLVRSATLRRGTDITLRLNTIDM